MTPSDLRQSPVEVGLQTETRLSAQGQARLRRADHQPVDRHARRCAASCRMPIACCCRAISFACASRCEQKRRRCWCPTSRSAATRPAATCWSSTATTWSSSARSRPGQLDGDLRVIESGLKPDDRVVVGGLLRAIPGQKVDPQLQTIERRRGGQVGPAMISKFFIERPVLANVIAILMILIGARGAVSACRSRNIPTSCRRPCRSRRAIPAPAPRP